MPDIQDLYVNGIQIYPKTSIDAVLELQHKLNTYDVNFDTILNNIVGNDEDKNLNKLKTLYNLGDFSSDAEAYEAAQTSDIVCDVNKCILYYRIKVNEEIKKSNIIFQTFDLTCCVQTMPFDYTTNKPSVRVFTVDFANKQNNAFSADDNYGWESLSIYSSIECQDFEVLGKLIGNSQREKIFNIPKSIKALSEQEFKNLKQENQLKEGIFYAIYE